MFRPDEVVEVHGQPQTFGVAGVRQMLRKLEWEMKGFGRDDIDRAFWTFNVAVTAWHLVDWAWHDLPDDRRVPRGKFRERCMNECPDLRLCGLIANSSKHGKRDPNRRRSGDELVVTVLLADVVHAKCGIATCGDPISTWTWRLFIRDGEHEHVAGDVFTRVLEFWQGFIEREIPESGRSDRRAA